MHDSAGPASAESVALGVADHLRSRDFPGAWALWDELLRVRAAARWLEVNRGVAGILLDESYDLVAVIAAVEDPADLPTRLRGVWAAFGETQLHAAHAHYQKWFQLLDEGRLGVVGRRRGADEGVVVLELGEIGPGERFGAAPSVAPTIQWTLRKADDGWRLLSFTSESFTSESSVPDRRVEPAAGDAALQADPSPKSARAKLRIVRDDGAGSP